MTRGSHDRLRDRCGRAVVVAVSLVLAVASVIGWPPPHAAAVTVDSEPALRAAFADPSETEIVLGADIDLTDCGQGAVTRPSGGGSLVVDGAGHIVTQTCPGSRVITNDGDELTLTDVVVAGGSLDAGDAEAAGGGIYSAGPLVMRDGAVRGNRADGELGGLGGGIAAMAGLTLERVVVADNTAGGGRSIFGGRGGGVYSGGDVGLVDSFIGGNTADGAESAGGSAGGLLADGHVVMHRSTLAENTAAAGTSTGGGMFGGAVVEGDLSLVNSTVHANVAAGDGSLHGGITSGGQLTLVYSAVTANAAATGSANVVFKAQDRSTASVVAEPGGGAPSCSAAEGTSGGHNFDGDGSCGLDAAGDQQSAGDPGLRKLADNGGPVHTRLPAEGSPLVDAIPLSACSVGDAALVSVDQRGVDRPQLGGCDIGPVELQAPTSPRPPTVPPPRPPSTAPPSTVPPATPASAVGGYILLEQDGDLHAFGAARELLHRIAPGAVEDDARQSTTTDMLKPALAGHEAVAIEATADGTGLWVLRSDGQIVSMGTARRLPGVDPTLLTATVAGQPERVTTMARVGADDLWVFTSAGRVIPQLGQLPPAAQKAMDLVLSLPLQGPIVDVVPTLDGAGALAMATDGGIFAYDAPFLGSVYDAIASTRGVPVGSVGPDQPTIGLTMDPDGDGYWAVATDGGVFTFRSPFRGALPALVPFSLLVAPVNGMVPYGNGYLLTAGDGGVFVFSNRPFSGSAAGLVDTRVVGTVPI